jgi:NADH pyrophosphatase NudC (nudix superfamily)
MEKFRFLVKGVVRYQDTFLAVERWYDDRIFDPYQWEFLDGVMEFGETPEAAVCRVCNERVGLNVEVVKPLYTWGFTAGEVCTAGIACLVDTNSPETVLSEDLHDCRWVTKDEIPHVITNNNVVEDIRNCGFIEDFGLDDFGDLDLFIDPMDIE